MARSESGANRDFWKAQLKAAEKRIQGLEAEIQKVTADLAVRGRKSREEIQELLRRAGETDFVARAEEIRGRLEKSGEDVASRLDRLQERALTALGVAGRAQVEQLGAEVRKLSRKIKKLARTPPRKGTRATG